jgi:transcriptional regulator with XRE-family HTH domain
MAGGRTKSGLRLVARGGDDSRRRPDVDRHVGRCMRERRILLGLSQQRLADLVGVTYQQAYKYEKGINRISAGRLFAIAGALGVDVGCFYKGLGGGPAEPPSAQRRALELARNFTAIPDARKRAVLWSSPGSSRARSGLGGWVQGEGRVRRGTAPRAAAAPGVTVPDSAARWPRNAPLSARARPRARARRGRTTPAAAGAVPRDPGCGRPSRPARGRRRGASGRAWVGRSTSPVVVLAEV